MGLRWGDAAEGGGHCGMGGHGWVWGRCCGDMVEGGDDTVALRCWGTLWGCGVGGTVEREGTQQRVGGTWQRDAVAWGDIVGGILWVCGGGTP